MPIAPLAAPLPLTPSATPLFQFPAGLPAFEDETAFRACHPAHLSPLVVLESARCAGLRFITAPVETLEAAYSLTLSPSDRHLLQWDGRAPLVALAILAFPAAGAPTANLLAPIVLNPATQRGVQSIQVDSGYSCRRPLHGQAGACS